jgi:hypothetical protein
MKTDAHIKDVVIAALRRKTSGSATSPRDGIIIPSKIGG